MINISYEVGGGGGAGKSFFGAGSEKSAPFRPLIISDSVYGSEERIIRQVKGVTAHILPLNHDVQGFSLDPQQEHLYVVHGDERHVKIYVVRYPDFITF